VGTAVGRGGEGGRGDTMVVARRRRKVVITEGNIVSEKKVIKWFEQWCKSLGLWKFGWRGLLEERKKREMGGGSWGGGSPKRREWWGGVLADVNGGPCTSA